MKIHIIIINFLCVTQLFSLDKWVLPSPTKRLDECSFLTTHNANAARNEGYKHVYQQVWSIQEQLDNGVRGFMFDVWEYAGKDGKGPYLCHQNCYTEGAQNFDGPSMTIVERKVLAYKRLSTALEEIKDFLEKKSSRNSDYYF